MQAKTLFLCKIWLFFFLATSVTYSISNSHTKLTSKKDIDKFKMISDELLCQCGCQMSLSRCNHLQCSAWSIRNTIDELIMQDKSHSFILNGFTNGFHKEVHNNSIFINIKNTSYSNLLPKYEHGFGEQILYKKPGFKIIIGIILFIIIAIVCLAIFIFKRKGQLQNTAINLSNKEQDLLKKLNEPD